MKTLIVGLLATLMCGVASAQTINIRPTANEYTVKFMVPDPSESVSIRRMDTGEQIACFNGPFPAGHRDQIPVTLPVGKGPRVEIRAFAYDDLACVQGGGLESDQSNEAYLRRRPNEPVIEP